MSYSRSAVAAEVSHTPCRLADSSARYVSLSELKLDQSVGCLCCYIVSGQR